MHQRSLTALLALVITISVTACDLTAPPPPLEPEDSTPPTTIEVPTEPPGPAPDVDPAPTTPEPVQPVDPQPSTPAPAPTPSGDPVPADAIVVATSGSDSAAGTAERPLRTVSRAVSNARSGATVVLRGGVYHEAFRIPANKAITVRSWPGETVWFDGSQLMTGWVRDGSRWRVDGWTVNFDNSPTYTRGAADSTQANWGFVNPAYPMAAHPDQVWIDDVPQRQVGSVAEVVAGTFHEDATTGRLYLGSDPSGRQVRAATLGRALLAQGPDNVVRDVGFRRFSPSVPDMGGVVFTGQRARVENVVISEMATVGLGVTNSDAVIRDVEIAHSGLLGIHASTADRLLLERVSSHHNNSERFNQAPVSGGFKFGRIRGLTIRDSSFNDNHGPGIWADVSPYDMTIVDSEFRNNAGHGISLELSAKALVANNVISGNGRFGIKVNNTSDVAIVNNTFIGNDRSVNIVQDSRVPTDPNHAYGLDRRQKQPDPTMTWINSPVLVQGNVIAHQRSGNCMLCVEDYSGRFSAEQLKVTANANLYAQDRAGATRYLVVWSRGAGNPATFGDLAGFQKATGQEQGGRLVIGSAPVDAVGRPAAGSNLAGAPAPTTAAVNASGLTSSARQFGALR